MIDIQDYPAHTGVADPNGYIAHSAPTIDGGGGPGWSGFAILLPWELNCTYEDRRILEFAFPHMESLLEFWFQGINPDDGLIHDWGVDEAAGVVVDQWTFLGDWLTPHGSEQAAPGQTSSPEAELFNNCYILYCVRTSANVARVLGDESKVSTYEASAEALAASINLAWFQEDQGIYLDSKQTHLVMPLISGAVSSANIDIVLRNLRAEVLEAQVGLLLFRPKNK
jgi:alpha-L-rhamnosidase